MGERVLSWVDCRDCKLCFPVEAKDENLETIENLEHIPKYCPFCGSTKISFDDLCTGYYG